MVHRLMYCNPRNRPNKLNPLHPFLLYSILNLAVNLTPLSTQRTIFSAGKIER